MDLFAAAFSFFVLRNGLFTVSSRPDLTCFLAFRECTESLVSSTQAASGDLFLAAGDLYSVAQVFEDLF